ncbi:MAG: hypothetical protein QG575_250 [Euryarchaeota archaeon]|nr:hypothetical protein [Euryarchaeota archaeon]
MRTVSLPPEGKYYFMHKYLSDLSGPDQKLHLALPRAGGRLLRAGRAPQDSSQALSLHMHPFFVSLRSLSIPSTCTGLGKPASSSSRRRSCFGPSICCPLHTHPFFVSLRSLCILSMNLLARSIPAWTSSSVGFAMNEYWSECLMLRILSKSIGHSSSRAPSCSYFCE